MGHGSCGWNHSLIVDNEGKIYSFGRNNYGQLGLGDTTDRNIPTLIDFQFDGNPIQVQQGLWHSMILTDTGKVYSFGNNQHGELGLGNTISYVYTPTLINYSFSGNPVSIQVGSYHSIIITNIGKVYSFGQYGYGRLGLGNITYHVYTPRLINYSFDGKPVKAQLGDNHSLILTDTGKVYSFGDNEFGQLGLGDTTNRTTPQLIYYSFNGKPVDIQQNRLHSLIVTDTGKVYSFGQYGFGKLGLGDITDNKTRPTLINFSFEGKPVKVQQGEWHSMILTDDGKVYSFGQSGNGQLGLGDNNNRNIPTLITYPFDGKPIEIYQGKNSSMVITDTGNVYVVGGNDYGQLGLGDTVDRNTFVNIWNVGILINYNLSILQDPTNGGTIKLNNQIITTPYSNEFDPNTIITVEQIPNENYIFLHWEIE